MDTRRLPFFVYGTLRPGEGNYAYLLDGRTTSEHRAILSGARMHDAGGFPFVLTDDDPASHVVGNVITVADHDYTTVQNSLDMLEGFFAEGHPANMYDRVTVEVTLDTGETVSALAYLTSPGYLSRVQSMPQIPSGDWIDHFRARRNHRTSTDSADDIHSRT